MVKPEDLRSIRLGLFQQCTKVDSFEELFAAEMAIASEIRRAEALQAQAMKTDVQFHIERLRLYADGLVWLILHPHVIRQMAKNVDLPKSLLQQGEAFDLVLQSASHYFKTLGVPVFISDITNILKIGDLVIVTNTEAPMIVETKKRLPKPEHLMQGRSGRQISRAIGTMKYLKEGSAKVFGDEHSRHVVETQTKARRNWDLIDDVCKKGLQTDWAELVVSDHEVMWAYRGRLDERLGREIQARSSDTGSQFLGTTLGLMNRVDGLFPPPSVWPVSTEVRWALLEEDLALIHLLDMTAFRRTHDTGDALEVDLSCDHPILVTIDDTVYPLSLKFIYDVLYGYETVESCVDGLFQFARQLHQMSSPDAGEAPSAKPVMHSVGTMEEAEAVISQGREGDSDLVAVAPLVYGYLNKSRELSKRGLNNAVFDRADRGIYVIMMVGDLRELVHKALE